MFGNYFILATGNEYNFLSLPLNVFLSSRISSSLTLQTGVSQWTGVSSTNFYNQTNLSSQPLYNTNSGGLPSIDYDGVDDNLRHPGYAVGVFTKFFVVKLDTPNGFLYSNLGDYIWSGSGSTFEVSRGGVISGKNISSGWLNNNKIKIVMWRFDGTHAGHQVWVNGVQKTTSNTGNTGNPGTALPTTSPANLGSRGTAGFSKGSIFAFIERPIVLTDAEAKAELDFLIKEFVPSARLDVNKNPILDGNGDFTYEYSQVPSQATYDVSFSRALDNTAPVTVSSLLDISGNGRDSVQALKSKQPTYVANSINGQNGATFGSGRFLQSSNFFDTTYNKSFTSFTVSKMAAQNAICVPYSATNTGGTYQHWTQRSGSNDNFFAWSEGVSGTDGIKTVSMYHNQTSNGATIEMFDYNGSVRTIRVGYLEQKTWSTGDLNIAGALTIGSREGAQYSFLGDVNAVNILKGSTKQQQDIVIDELNGKYQIYTSTNKTYFNKFVVCFDGHSIANGWNTEGSLMQNYANRVMQSIGSGTFWNTAQPAKATVYLNNQAPARVDPIFVKKTYVENGTTKNMNNILVYYEATNSINLQNLTAQQTYNDVKAYCQARKVANPELKIILIPCGPQGATPKSTQVETDAEAARIASYEARRIDYNAMVLAAFNAGETWIDGYVRTDLDPRIDTWNATYYNNTSGPDYVHPNSTGHQIIADLLKPVLLGLVQI